jgi:UDP:flavonoid glycosyltransferase YjiC (YdhE family)
VICQRKWISSAHLRPNNTRLVHYVPYHQLLPHVAVMVSNGGYHGVFIALQNGVPLVVTRAQSDKPEICAQVAWSGAGMRLRSARPSPSAIRRAVLRVLREPEFKRRAVQLASGFAKRSAGASSALLLEELARTRRPVLRSERSSA